MRYTLEDLSIDLGIPLKELTKQYETIEDYIRMEKERAMQDESYRRAVVGE